MLFVLIGLLPFAAWLVCVWGCIKLIQRAKRNHVIEITRTVPKPDLEAWRTLYRARPEGLKLRVEDPPKASP